VLARRHRLGGRADPRQERDRKPIGRFEQARARPRRHHELAACIDRVAHLQRRAHGTGTNDGSRHFRHLLDHLQRMRRTERHFEHRQSARNQRLGQRSRFAHIVENDDRNNRRERQRGTKRGNILRHDGLLRRTTSD
jgi:hypothetical protein